MRNKESANVPVGLADLEPAAASAQIATVVGLLDDGTPLVQLDAASPAVPARLALRTTRDRLDAAIAGRHQTVLLLEDGDPSRPIIVGFIETVEPAPEAPDERAPVLEADVDGKRVRVTARDEIVLQCGSASVTLRRNGRVIIRGTYVETHSDGTNRIKGGQVQIN